MDAIEVGMVKRPRDKREEIEKIRKLNWAQAVVYKESCFAHAKVEGMMVGLPQGNGGY
ncbi:PREDICTED: probable BOI-related E3 ubiquitin-ligase 3, partial [Prunus dulcis]